jgi:hypothetical protein
VDGELKVGDNASSGTISFTLSVDAVPASSSSPAGPTATPTGTPGANQVSYASTVQPILTQSCSSLSICHDNTSPAAGLAYTSRTATLESVVPGNASNSLLYQSLIGDGAEQMPVGGTLSASQIQSIADWINQGALNN